MDNDADKFKAGQRVRLKSAPDRTGILTGESMSRADRVRLQLDFNPGKEFKLVSELELVDVETIESLLELKKYGRLHNMRSLLTHARLSGRLADVIYSMEATNTEFLPYQFKPVLNFLDSPSQGILIADEVGLGKTIEAGLIWTELKARFDAGRLLIVCPAMLCQKWKDELITRFGVNAELCNAHELLVRLKDSTARSNRNFAIICSMQGIRPPRGWDDRDNELNTGAAKLALFLEEQSVESSLLDCVIVDEAHVRTTP